jgi:hypothetical protein
LVEQSLRKREVGGSSPSTGTTIPLPHKLGLTLVSICAYWLVVGLVEVLEAREGFPAAGQWFHYVVGGIFGALVMSPYAGAPHRAPRLLAVVVAGALIYYLAIRFVTEGPQGLGSTASFVMGGGGAALLVGIAVMLIGTVRLAWSAVPLTLAAGSLGGAAFELVNDTEMLVGHASWQILVCLALHFSLDDESQAPR